MAGAIATVTGTALRPGVSANKRLYSTEQIAKAVTRAQARIADGGMPLTMRISHPADEPRAPVTEIVGRISRIWQETDGRIGYEALLADTPEGHTVKALVDNRNGPPFLKGVSIRGSWIGRPRKVLVAGELVETADDMEIDGLDFTHRPGVTGAGVETVTDPVDQPDESAPERTPINESVEEALVTAPIIEAAPADTATEAYADLGYQGDGQKRYPIGTVAEARAAWTAINETNQAREYTAKQLKRVRERVVKALRSHGVQVEEGVMVARGPITEAVMLDYANPASFGINLDNGMVCVSVSSYRIDPHDLDLVARAAMKGACAALAAIDPDTDGDIDIPVTGSAGSADDMEAAPPGPPVEAAPAAEPAIEPVTPPAPVPAADPITETEAPGMTEPTTPAVAASPAATTQDLSDASITKLTEAIGTTVGTAMAQALASFAAAAAPAPVAAPVEAAPAVAAPAPVVEAAPAAVVETEDQRIARLVEAQVTKFVQESVVKNGPPARKGIVGRVTESGAVEPIGTGGGELNAHGLPSHWPDKPLHEFTSEERRHLSAAMLEHTIGNRI